MAWTVVINTDVETWANQRDVGQQLRRIREKVEKYGPIRGDGLEPFIGERIYDIRVSVAGNFRIVCTAEKARR
ncbi:MAG: hypothetical protein M3O32_11565, partial [Actinomycetota bacterium]|nr:hypothetical protein [Actinomycetota bacterium]